MHGIALIETRADDQKDFEIRIEQGSGRMAGARIAEDAERQRMVFGKDAFRPQCGCDRDRPALGRGS